MGMATSMMNHTNPLSWSTSGNRSSRTTQEYITFPQTAQQIQDTQQQFFAYGNFPGIIGAIDCTHVPIQTPGGPNARFFINRKCRSSINTQVCKTKSDVYLVFYWYFEFSIKGSSRSGHAGNQVSIGSTSST